MPHCVHMSAGWGEILSLQALHDTCFLRILLTHWSTWAMGWDEGKLKTRKIHFMQNIQVNDGKPNQEMMQMLWCQVNPRGLQKTCLLGLLVTSILDSSWTWKSPSNNNSGEFSPCACLALTSAGCNAGLSTMLSVLTHYSLLLYVLISALGMNCQAKNALALQQCNILVLSSLSKEYANIYGGLLWPHSDC